MKIKDIEKDFKQLLFDLSFPKCTHSGGCDYLPLEERIIEELNYFMREKFKEILEEHRKLILSCPMHENGGAICICADKLIKDL